MSRHLHAASSDGVCVAAPSEYAVRGSKLTHQGCCLHNLVNRHDVSSEPHGLQLLVYLALSLPLNFPTA